MGSCVELHFAYYYFLAICGEGSHDPIPDSCDDAGGDMKDRIILDLCGGTGSWSKPYKDAGYDVRLVTLPENDVRSYLPPEKVWGILCAPPCTHFSRSGAQYWEAKDQDGRTLFDTKILAACLMIIAKSQPRWWALENTAGRLKDWIGKPKMFFNPCDYGDAYTKYTALWGIFNSPQNNPVEPVFIIDSKRGRRYSPIHWYKKDPSVRAITPQGFANAFFKANP